MYTDTHAPPHHHVLSAPAATSQVRSLRRTNRCRRWDGALRVAAARRCSRRYLWQCCGDLCLEAQKLSCGCREAPHAHHTLHLTAAHIPRCFPFGAFPSVCSPCPIAAPLRSASTIAVSLRHTNPRCQLPFAPNAVLYLLLVSAQPLFSFHTFRTGCCVVYALHRISSLVACRIASLAAFLLLLHSTSHNVSYITAPHSHQVELFCCFCIQQRITCRTSRHRIRIKSSQDAGSRTFHLAPALCTPALGMPAVWRDVLRGAMFYR